MFSRRTSWNLEPNALTHAVEAYRRGGRELLDLTASNPTQVGLRYDEKAILAALANPEALRYVPEPRGLPVARRAVADYYRQLPHAATTGQISPEQIVLTVSTSEAYSFAFRLLCDPGDEVLVPTPSYPLFEFLAELQDVRLVRYSLVYDHGWQIDFHTLQRALTPRSRAIILVHPNNPTGSYVSAAEADQLNLLAQHNRLALVVDEVFLDYSLGPPASALSSFAFNREALTFTLSGISKISGLPQMKLAWILTSGAEELAAPARSRLEVIADTYLSMNAPIQLAAPALLQQCDSVRRQLLARIQANLEHLDEQLRLRPICSRLQVQGGWYVIARVPVTRSDEQFCIELLEKTGVLVQPGYFYDFHSDGYIVLSLITPEDAFREGVRRLLEFVG